jgi:hypothetical protein
MLRELGPVNKVRHVTDAGSGRRYAAGSDRIDAGKIGEFCSALRRLAALLLVRTLLMQAVTRGL